MFACKFSRILTVAAVLLTAALPAVFAQTASSEGKKADDNFYPALLERLDAFSPTAPDQKIMAAIYKFRSQAQDDELRALLDNFTATGLIALNRADLYKGGVKPVMANVADFESAGLIKCKKCAGAAKEEYKCQKCGGSGQCPACKGTGWKRVSSASLMKGPSRGTHTRLGETEDEEVKCDACNRSGECPACGGEGKKERPCLACGGSGKIWDTASMVKNLAPAYEKLRSAVQARSFEAKIALSLVTIKTDAGTFYGPLFAFGGTKVVAVPARALTSITEFKLYTPSKDSLPVAGILAAKNRDLVFLDLGDIPLVNLLTLETDYKKLTVGKPVYAYGFSRENEASVCFDGKVTDAGPQNLRTTVATEKIADCAPLITDSGDLAGIFMYPIATYNNLGIAALSQENGQAVRFDNIEKTDFVSLTVEDLRQRNSALAFTQRAIKAAKEMLELDMDTLKAKRSDISEAIKRLDRAVAMIKGVKSWDVFMMAETAGELANDASTRASNLEALFGKITAYEAEQKQKAEDAAAAAAALPVETVEKAPAEVKTPPPAQKTKTNSSKKTADKATSMDELNLFAEVNWMKVGIIAGVVIVLLTVIFILMGVIQDKMRRKKLSAPPVIPDFIREMQEYERKHPQK